MGTYTQPLAWGGRMGDPAIGQGAHTAPTMGKKVGMAGKYTVMGRKGKYTDPGTGGDRGILFGGRGEWSFRGMGVHTDPLPWRNKGEWRTWEANGNRDVHRASGIGRE